MSGRFLFIFLGACAVVLLFTSCEGVGPKADRAGATAETRELVTSRDAPPAQARAAFVAERQATGASDPAYAVHAMPSGGFIVHGPAVRMRAELGTDGATLGKAGETWSATLAGTRYGCLGAPLAPIERAGGPDLDSSANRVNYKERAAGVAIDEWFLNGPLGLEQGFTVGRNACAEAERGKLVIDVDLRGLHAVANPSGEGLDLRDEGGSTRVRYTDLSARDANGLALDAQMKPTPDGFALWVSARGATFPVTVDPLAWLPTAQIVAPAAEEGDKFGIAVAFDGPLALVGADAQTVPNTAGAVYVFAQSGTTWAQQAELTSQTYPPNPGSIVSFGCSVALSGTTALVGENGAAAADAGGRTQGKVYVFAQSGTSWMQQADLTSSDPPGDNNTFGTSVSLSGTTALIGAGVGADNVGVGAAFVFVQSGTTWTQQQKFVDPGTSGLGSSVSVSGTIALVGAPLATVASNASQGAAYVFVQSGTTWMQQQELTASDGAAGDQFAYSVSLSGTTALIGAQNKALGGNTFQGAAYVFVRSGTTWTQHQELTASDGASGDKFGSSIALSATRALVGAQGKTVGPNASQGAAYMFVQSGTTWTLQQELTASDGLANDLYGSSVSLSGNTALIGASEKSFPTNRGVGAAYIEAFLSTTGSSCTADTDCGSGHCVVGVCCDAACTGACQSCSLTGSTGTCTNVPAGGSGSPTCAPFTCTGSSIACPTSCDGDGQCITGDYCHAGSCVPKQASGGACAAPDQCASGNCQDGMCLGLQANGTACTSASGCINGQCVDGLCCDEACTGQCQACDVPGLGGTCSQVSGAPHGARGACAGTGTPCGATCGPGGGPMACAYTPIGTTCAAPSCSSDKVIETTCDGMGACRAGTPSTCAGALACEEGTQSCSRASCTQNSDCASGYRCANGSCQPAGGSICSGHTSMSTAGDAGSIECAPYTCENATGKCFTTCKSVADCAAPNVCNSAGHCLAPPTTEGASGGCTAAPDDSSLPGTLLWSAGTWLAAARRRRREGAGRSCRQCPRPKDK